jgi:EmrB/QacA subfamily drug resistance transporter
MEAPPTTSDPSTEHTSASMPERRRAHPRRWAILAVLCVAVFITVLDGTIVNVALPSLARELDASMRELQWVVDAYLLVFTGLLLAAGGLGDRYGRRRALLVGLGVFGLTSAFAGAAAGSIELIAGRALMGIGAAFIFPATLAILTNTFTDAAERAKAIGVWSAVAGVAVAAGPIVGGWLLEHFWWGSVFYVNVPIVAAAFFGVWTLVPESRDDDAPALDLRGLVLSIAAIGTLVFAIIQAPEWGWVSPTTVLCFTVAVGLVAGFIVWELRTAHPMLPVRIFKNRRFSAASASITAAFFALFGFIFLITQYFQLIRGYSPLEAGVRTLPVALSIAVASVVSPRIVARLGTTGVVTTGLVLMAAGFVWVSTASAVTPYAEIVGQMVLLGVGLGFTTAPATESIMGAVSLGKAGVSSAVNDTTRELGGTLGVAIVGSVFSSVYVGALQHGGVFTSLSPAAQTATERSVGAAEHVAARLGAAAPRYLAEVSDAFLSALGTACLVVAGVALFGALVAARLLPARAAPGTGATPVQSDAGVDPMGALCGASTAR